MKPKRFKKNVFVLYSPQRIILRPGNYTQVDMKTSVYIPDEIVATCTLLPTFQQSVLKLENNNYISVIDNMINIHEPLNLPWKIQLELLNRNIDNITFSINKGQEIGYFMRINKGLEILNVNIIILLKSKSYQSYSIKVFFLSSNFIISSFICCLNFDTCCCLFKKKLLLG